MKVLYLAIALYLMYYTFKLGLQVWKEENKAAGVVLYMISVFFPVLAILLFFSPI